MVNSSRERGILICIKVHKDRGKLEIQHGYPVSLILCIENDNSHGKNTKEKLKHSHIPNI